MGYYIRIAEGTVTIPKENVEEAYRRMCALNDNDSLKRGGQWGGDVDKDSPRPAGLNYHPAKWFSWMDPDYPNKCADAKTILDQLGFESLYNEDIVIFGYDNKAGQEDLFLRAISDLCTKDSYLVWHGEDGEMWKEFFGGPTVETMKGVITWV